MQLAYDDPSTAYRLQDRISSMHRNGLEKIIEKVLDEFSIPGHVVKIDTLKLNLGDISDADLDLLLPKALEDALRDELGQLMVRKDFDPMIEIETIPVTQNQLATWLYYIERGVQSWTSTSSQPDIVKLIAELDAKETQWLRERLLQILRSGGAVDRLINQVKPTLLLQLLALLTDGTIAEVSDWINRTGLQLAQAFDSSGVSKDVEHYTLLVARQLFVAWAPSSFATVDKEKAKVRAIKVLQQKQFVSLETPLPEVLDELTRELVGKIDNIKLLRYILYYGYWPAGNVPQDIEAGQHKQLGAFVLSVINETPTIAIEALRELLVYPSARKRLVHQLSVEQVREIMVQVYPDVVDKVDLYGNWVQAAVPQQSTALTNVVLERAIWLALIEQKVVEPQSSIGIAWFTGQLANLIVQHLSKADVGSLVQYLKSIEDGTSVTGASSTIFDPDIVSAKGALSQKVQSFTIAIAKELFAKHTVKGSEKEEEKKKDNRAGDIREIETESGTAASKEALAEHEIEQVLVDDKSSERTIEQLIHKAEEREDAAVEDIAEEIAEPKNQLEAFIYFLKRGVWPAIFGNIELQDTAITIVVLEAVFVELLQEKPIELLLELYPLLTHERVRERLGYQLGHETVQALVTNYAELHKPVAQLNEYYRALLPLVMALGMEKAEGLPNASTTFKTFILWLLFEEPTIKHLDAFATYFLVYWHRKSTIDVSRFTALVTAQLDAIVTDNTAAVKPLMAKMLVAFEQANAPKPARSAAELETEAIEQMTAAMLLMYEDEQEGGGEAALFTPKTTDRENLALQIEESGTDDSVTEKEPLASNDEALAKQYSTKDAAGERDVPMSLDREGEFNAIDEDTELEKIQVDDSSDQLQKLEKGEDLKAGGDMLSQTENTAEDIASVGDSQNDDTLVVSTQTHEVSELMEGKVGIVEQTITSDNDDVEIGEKPIEEGEEQPDLTTDIEAYPLLPIEAMPFADAEELIEEDEQVVEPKTLRQQIERITHKQLPKVAEQPKPKVPQKPTERTEPEGPLEEPVFIENAGMVLLWPFIGRCFTTLGYTNKGLFKDMASANRAVHLLQYMVTGEEQAPEYLLVLNKILCGIPLFEAVERDVILTAQEKEEADVLLRAVIGNWDKMKALSVPAFRDSFLKRGGRITENEASWTLRVDQAAYDMLLDTLPWTIGMIKLRYMEKVLYTEWR